MEAQNLGVENLGVGFLHLLYSDRASCDCSALGGRVIEILVSRYDEATVGV